MKKVLPILILAAGLSGCFAKPESALNHDIPFEFSLLDHSQRLEETAIDSASLQWATTLQNVSRGEALRAGQ